jgi:hypothetical protein
MKKVIIITQQDELTTSMYLFGTNCVKSFINDLDKETYGKDWKDCAYSNDDYSAWVDINKSGTISVCIYDENKGI